MNEKSESVQWHALDSKAVFERLGSGDNLQVDESALTGESQAVAKQPENAAEDAPMADRHNMAWMSTNITGGRGLAVVVETGMRTAMGPIAGEVRATIREDTPLQKRMHKLGLVLGAGGIVLAALVFGLGLLRGHEWMDGHADVFRGGGYQPEGEVRQEGGEEVGERSPALERLLRIGVLSNNAALTEEDGQWSVEGNPSEGALLAVAIKAGMDIGALRNENQRFAKIPFSSDAKYNATLHPDPNGDGRVAYVKGAPERIFDFCSQMLQDGKRTGSCVSCSDQIVLSFRDLVRNGMRNGFKPRRRELASDMRATGFGELSRAAWHGYPIRGSCMQE